MDSTGSFIRSVIEQIRYLLDNVIADAKYDDAFLARTVIPSAIANVMGEVRMNQDDLIVIRSSISVVAGTENYLLPPCVGEVWRLGKLDSYGNLTHDWRPNDERHPDGPGWSLQANMISFRPIPQTTETWTLWWTPSADATCHVGTGEVVSTTVIELAETPTLGILDRRHNAYVGAVIRILESDRVLQERVITSYSTNTRLATVDVPFTSLPTAGQEVDYEIAPIFYRPMLDAVALKAAMVIGVPRDISEKQMMYLDKNYSAAMKALSDHLTNKQLRTGKGIDWKTLDNQEFTNWYYLGLPT